MTENLSKINHVYESLGDVITHSEDFEEIPIYWGMIELTANEMPPTCVVFETLPFGYDMNTCNFSAQLDVIIIHNTDYVREITKRLTKYSESMVDLLNNHIINGYHDYQLQFLQGSEIRAKQNNRKDAESYKGSKMLYSSLIVLSYNLRY